MYTSFFSCLKIWKSFRPLSFLACLAILHDGNTCFFRRFQLFLQLSPRLTFKSSLSSRYFSIFFAASSQAANHFRLSSTSRPWLSFQYFSFCGLLCLPQSSHRNLLATRCPPFSLTLNTSIFLPSLVAFIKMCFTSTSEYSVPKAQPSTSATSNLKHCTVVRVLLHPCNSRSFLNAPKASFFRWRKGALLRQQRYHPSFRARRSLNWRSFIIHVFLIFHTSEITLLGERKRTAIPQNPTQSPNDTPSHITVTTAWSSLTHLNNHKHIRHERQSHTPTRTHNQSPTAHHLPPHPPQKKGGT